jgi:hypothetical protein
MQFERLTGTPIIQVDTSEDKIDAGMRSILQRAGFIKTKKETRPGPLPRRFMEKSLRAGVFLEDGMVTMGRGPHTWSALTDGPIKRNRGLQSVELELEQTSEYAASIGMADTEINLNWLMGHSPQSVGFWTSDGREYVCGVRQDVDADGFGVGNPDGFGVGDKLRMEVDTDAADLIVSIQVNGKERARLPVEEGWVFGVSGTADETVFRLKASSEP